MANLVKIAINDNSKYEYTPDLIYKIYIKDLFRAYLKSNHIKKYEIKKIKLPETEKITEDLNFDTTIIETRDINEIIKILF